MNEILKNYIHVHNSTFYENEETFVNTEGFVKRTTQLIQRKQTKNCWQILRKILHYCKINLFTLTLKDNQILFFNSKRFYSFKNFLAIQYYAVQNITKSSFYLTVVNKTMILTLFNFKSKTKKVLNTKLKHCLDDFFTGGKDEYSQYSKILRHCSKNLRAQFLNFQNF